MKGIRVIAVTGILFAAIVVTPAYAQPAGTTASASAAQSITGAAAPASKASNRALAKRVRRALAKTSGMVLTDISVRAKDGAVTLVGSVPSAALIEQAAQVASSVDGVSSVTNRLSVRIDPRSFNGR